MIDIQSFGLQACRPGAAGLEDNTLKNKELSYK